MSLRALRSVLRWTLIAAGVLWLALFLFGAALVSSGIWYRRSSERLVRPWLKVRFSGRGIDAPHAISAERRVEVQQQAGGSWTTVLDGGRNVEVIPLAGDGCVLVTTVAVVGDRALLACPEGKLVKIPNNACDSFPEVEADGRFVWCTRCRLERGVACLETVISEWMPDGARTDRKLSDSAGNDARRARPPIAPPSWF